VGFEAVDDFFGAGELFVAGELVDGFAEV